MKNKMTFDEAYQTIEQIVQEMENDSIPLDELAAKVKTAKELLAFCNDKLRNIEAELQEPASENA